METQEAEKIVQEEKKEVKPKVKQKMIFAKSKTEGVVAIIVMTIFLGMSAYNIHSFIKSRQTPPQRVQSFSEGRPVPLSGMNEEMMPPIPPQEEIPPKK